MTKRKERTLKELYDATERLSEPEITPVLKGSCRIQGPVDEADDDIQTNTGSSRAEKRFSRLYPSEEVQTKPESATCNVCSTPCSSCMHINRVVSFMDSKTEDEFLNQTCWEKASTRYSFNDADVLPPLKRRACNDRQPTPSETTNVLSASSSHDSFSEHAESKTTLRTFDISDTPEDIEMLPKLLSGRTVGEDQLLSKLQSVAGQSAVTSSSSHIASDLDRRTFSNQLEEQKGFECHGDNILFVSGANDTNVPIDDLNVDIKSSASVSSLLPEGLEKTVPVQTASGCPDEFHYEIQESHNNSGRPSTFIRESVQKKSPTNTSTAVFPNKSESLEISPSKDVCASNSSPKVRSPYSHSRSGKSLFCNADTKELQENSCSRLTGEPSKYSTEHGESSLAKVFISSDGVAEQKTAYILSKFGNNKPSFARSSSSGASMKFYTCLEVDTAIDSGDPQAEAMKNLVQSEQVEKSHESLEVPDMHEPPLNGGDELDIVEDDVNVCDICGDAGREELLVFCSRCSDGAEHTYCMRIMLNKVPEGDWLCEECKLKEETEDLKEEKFEKVSGISKTSCLNEIDENSGDTCTINSKLFLKLDVKVPNAEATKVSSSLHLPAKRQLDSPEVVSAAKRQALEISVGSPKVSGLGKKAVLSRDSSLKNLDKGKVKPSHQIPSPGGHAANSSQDTAHSTSNSGHNSWRIHSQLHLPRGTFLKSNSFNVSNSQPKVKVVQEDVPIGKKLDKEAATTDIKKQGFVKTLSKSMSLKTTSSGRSNATESKVKMLSSKFSKVEDLRGSKQAKERNLMGRNNTFKLDRPLVSSPTAVSSVSISKADQKVASRCETISSLSSGTNHHDLKAVQPDAKLSSSLKPPSLLANIGTEIPVPLAGSVEVKRQSSCLSSVLGAPPYNGRCSSTEKKLRQVIPKDELTLSSWSVDKSCSKPDATLQDALPLSRESTNQDEESREPPVCQSRQSVSVRSQKIRCHKCKEIGHAAQVCAIGSPRISVLQGSSARSSREGKNKGNKLKETPEAAMLKTPVSYRQNRLPDQSEELSISSTDLSCETVSKDQLSTSSSCLRNLNSGEGTNDRQEIFRSSASDASKINSANVNQHAVHPMEAVCTKVGHLDDVFSLDRRKMMPSLSKLPCLTSVAVVPSRVFAIPEHNFIWQGGFEMLRSGILPDFCDGIQAHLSTCASPRVLEVVNKFPYKILMEEVPRLSMWPVQFQEKPTTESSIALYFFAKDLESYERHYKSLLDNMMKNDLALKGKFDGIELLIFPSNLLPEKSQRWNLLFFLWGVFRGRRVNCLENVSGCQKNLSQSISDVVPVEQDLSDHVMPMSQKICSSGLMKKDLSASNRSFNAQQVAKSNASVELPFLSSSGRVDRNCDIICLDQKSLGLQENFNQQGSGFNIPSVSNVPTGNVLLCAEMQGNIVSLKEHIDPESKQEAVLQSYVQASKQNSSFNKGKLVPKKLDNSLDGRDTSSFKVSPVGTSFGQESGAVRNMDVKKVHERIKNSSRDLGRIQNKVKEEVGLMDMESALKGDVLRSDLMEKEHGNWESDKKSMHSDSVPVSQASGETTSISISQAILWEEKMERSFVDGESECKKMKQCFSATYDCNSYRDQNFSNDRPTSHIDDLDPSFPIKEQRYDGTYDDVMISETRATERHFFPMDSSPMKDHRSGGTSVLWQGLSSGDGDRVGYEVPNLELALGAGKRPSKQGILPLFVGRANKRNNNEQNLDSVTINKDNEDVSASLSLSLAFPFSDKERIVKPISRTEQLLPERQRVNTSLLLSGDFPGT